MGDPRLTLRGRLGAARLALDDASPACKDAVSRCQANAVIDMMRRFGPSLSAEDRATLLEQAMLVPWTPSDLDAISTCIAGPTQAKVDNRRHSQDYRAIVHYLDERRWKLIGDDEISGDAKEDLLIDLSRALGLQLPSELTFKRMACIIMMSVEPWSEVSTKSIVDKKQNLLLLKKKWHTSARKFAAMDTWVPDLPSIPAEFQRLYPLLWASAFTEDSVPILPRLDERRLNLLDASFKARGNAGEPISQVLSLSNGSGSSTGLDSQLQNTLVPMGNMMMQCMQQMARQQQQFMEYMVSPTAQGSGRQPSGLKALIDATSPRLSTRTGAHALLDAWTPPSSRGDSPLALTDGLGLAAGARDIDAVAKAAAVAAKAADEAAMEAAAAAAKAAAAKATKVAEDKAAEEARAEAEKAKAAAAARAVVAPTPTSALVVSGKVGTIFYF